MFSTIKADVSSVIDGIRRLQLTNVGVVAKAKADPLGGNAPALPFEQPIDEVGEDGLLV
jgi:hypothetical protein